MDWQTLKELFLAFLATIGINNWQDAASATTVVGVIFALIGVYYYINNIKWNRYQYLADLYYEILKKDSECPHFCDPEKTRNYESEFSSEKYRYDASARMCCAYAEDIYAASSNTFFKKYFIKLYAPTFERIKTIHGSWLQNNRSTFLMKGFFEFVDFNKWRDYLDSSAAERLRWEYIAYNYDEKILNPMRVGINCLFSWGEIPDGDRFQEVLKHLGVTLIKPLRFERTNNDKIINVFSGSNSLSLERNDEKVILIIDDGKIRKTHEFIAKTENSKLNIYRKNPMLEYVRKISASELIVADAGCGNGYFVKILAESDAGKFKKIYGLDYSDNMVKNAKKKCESFEKKVEILKEDIRDLTHFREDLKQKYNTMLDKIFSINSILPPNPNDTEKMLSQISLILKPGGEFVAILPSFDTVEYLKSLEFNKFKENREEYLRHYFKNLPFKEKILSYWDGWKLFYYYFKFYRKMKSGTWKHMKFWDRIESGAMLDTWKLFYQGRKMNDNKKLYADDGVNIQRFFHEKDIEPILKKVGLNLKQLEKLYYPWDMTKKFNYGYFPGKEEIWDWFVVAEKMP